MHTTILTDLVQQFLQATSSWYQALIPIAKSLFVTLAAIQLAWSAAWWVIEEDDLNPILVHLLRRLLALGFFWAVLVNANVWVPAVIDGFVAAGKRAAAAAGANLQELNPSTVLDQGILVSSSLWNAVDTSGWLTAIAGALLAALVSLLVFLSFAVIAANLVVALVEMCVVIGGGVLLLGFAGSSWTLPFAERYLSLAVSTGVKLFLLYLIVGLGTALAASWEPMIAAAGGSAPQFFQVLAGALVYAFVASKVPAYASGLLGGSVATHFDTALRSAAIGRFVGVRAGRARARDRSARSANDHRHDGSRPLRGGSPACGRKSRGRRPSRRRSARRLCHAGCLSPTRRRGTCAHGCLHPGASGGAVRADVLGSAGIARGRGLVRSVARENDCSTRSERGCRTAARKGVGRDRLRPARRVHEPTRARKPVRGGAGRLERTLSPLRDGEAQLADPRR